MKLNSKQRLIPIVLVFISAISIYYLANNRQITAKEYNVLLGKAREEALNGVVVDASEDYEKLLEMKPSFELALEAGNMYLQNEEYTSAFKWYERKLLTSYSDEPGTYEFGINVSIAAEKYADAFSVYNTYQKRSFTAESVEELMKPIMYKYVVGRGYDDVSVFTDAKGIAAVCQNGYWGYIDMRGGQITRYQYEKAGMMGDYAPVVDTSGKAYYIDTEGNLKLPASYYEASDKAFGKIKEFRPIQSSLVLAGNGKKWNYYSLETREKLFGGYADATVITDGVGAVSMDGKTWALISSEGETITDYKFEDVLQDNKGIACRSGCLIVKEAGKYYLVDVNGKRLNDSAYDDARAFNDATLAAVDKNGKWIFVDTEGKEYDLGKFKMAQSFSHGLAGVRIGNSWGYIDMQGEVVVECQFADVRPVSTCGVTFVYDKDAWKLLTFYKDNYDSM
jgi:tetratricopeptide (TPR) repeat protein